MKPTKILFWIITLLLIAGIFGTGELVLTEIKTGDGCPKLGPIPACFFIFICFIIPFFLHVLKKWHVVYFVFTGLAALIAFFASIMQITGNAECPKTDSGIPMCYLSLLIFTTLIILKNKQLNYGNN